MASKPAKKSRITSRPKRITIDTKKEIIKKHETGVRVSELSKQYDMAKSTICTILKNKDALKLADVATGVTALTKQRSNVLEETEKLLLLWIKQKQHNGDRVSEALICKEALFLHNDLVAKMSNKSDTSSINEFKASRGWLNKFRRRCGLHTDVNRRKRGQDADDDYVPYEFIDCVVDLEVNEKDEVKLGKDCGQEFVTLECLKNARKKQFEEKNEEKATIEQIKEICSKWSDVQCFIKKYHPDKTGTSVAVDIFNQNVMSHFQDPLLQQCNEQKSDSVRKTQLVEPTSKKIEVDSTLLVDTTMALSCSTSVE